MSHEGFVLITRIGAVLLLICMGAVIRTFVGPSKQRGVAMGIGTLGGLAVGVALGDLAPSAFHIQESALFAVACMLLGEGVAWHFARQIPREAN